MSNLHKDSKIWFVYDGECPLCKNAALALRIKKDYGKLNLLNARTEIKHPLIEDINEQRLDLDYGMVIYDGSRFYHGKDALIFMAKYGDNKGLFNITNKVLYWSNGIAKITYPWLRGIRNALLKYKRIKRIDNLNLKEHPIFKGIFGDNWDNLPPVMRNHYANRPYSNDITVVKGKLDVMCAGSIKVMAWVFWIMRGIPPYNENNVPVTVKFQSDEDTKFFHFNRVFYFKTRKPYSFKSRMIQVHNNEVIEIMASRLGWRMNYFWEDNRIKLKHKGYILYAFGLFIPLPLTYILGAGNAEEIPIDDNNFDMVVTITHPWWGKIYEYKGQFEVVTVNE